MASHASSSSSATSLDSPLSPSFPFHRLPYDLVKSVVDQIAVSPWLMEDAYKERKKDLGSLCLTSKMFRKLAQPLLNDWVEVDRDPQASAVRALVANNTPESLGSIRYLNFEKTSAASAEAVTKLSKSASGLEEISCYWYFSPALHFRRSKITTLALSELDLSGLPVKFLEVKYLSMSRCDLGGFGSPRGLTGPPPIMTVPSLRHLVFIPYRTKEVSPTETRVLNKLAPLLTTITLPIDSAPTLPPSLTESILRCYRAELYDTCHFPLAAPSATALHLSFEFDPDISAEEEAETLLEWASMILKPTKLRVLILPPIPDSTALHPSFHAAIVSLLDICRRSFITVFYQEQVVGSKFWTEANYSFLKWADKLKEEKDNDEETEKGES